MYHKTFNNNQLNRIPKQRDNIEEKTYNDNHNILTG